MRGKEIINIHGNLFEVIRKFPLNRINIEKFENGVSLLKKFYHVDTIFKAQGLFWFCNKIEDLEYEEI